jgi:hypothetical protein
VVQNADKIFLATRGIFETKSNVLLSWTNLCGTKCTDSTLLQEKGISRP